MRWSIAVIFASAACEGETDPTSRSPEDGPAITDDPDADTDADSDSDDDPDTDTDTGVGGTYAAPDCRATIATGVSGTDGSTLFVYTFTHDADGRLVEVVRDYAPVDGFGSLTTITYDAAGRKLTDELDEKTDGTVDLRKTWTYDGAGLPATLTVDFDADGVFESTTTYTHDAQGVLTTVEFVTTFAAPDWEDTLLYDFGTVVRRERDHLIDGSIDEVTDFVYDPYGIAVLENTTHPDDGSALRTVTRTTDGAGHVLTILFEDFEGGSTILVTYVRDAVGNVATVERDPGADGTPSEITTYVWDCD